MIVNKDINPSENKGHSCKQQKVINEHYQCFYIISYNSNQYDKGENGAGKNSYLFMLKQINGTKKKNDTV